MIEPLTPQDIRNQQDEDLKAMLRLAEGRNFLKRLFHESRVFVSTYTGEYGSMAFNEGARALGLRYFHEVNQVDPKWVAFFAQPPAVGCDKIDDV